MSASGIRAPFQHTLVYDIVHFTSAHLLATRAESQPVETAAIRSKVVPPSSASSVFAQKRERMPGYGLQISHLAAPGVLPPNARGIVWWCVVWCGDGWMGCAFGAEGMCLVPLLCVSCGTRYLYRSSVAAVIGRIRAAYRGIRRRIRENISGHKDVCSTMLYAC